MITRISRFVQGRLSEVIPEHTNVESYRDENLNNWRSKGSYSSVSVSKSHFSLSVNRYEYGQVLFADIQHLLNQVTEQRAHICNALVAREEPSPTWLFVSTYYLAFYAAMAWSRAINQAIIYLDKEAISKFCFAKVGIPAGGAYEFRLTPNATNSPIVTGKKLSNSHFHEAVWVACTNSTSALRKQLQQEISARKPMQEELVALRTLDCFEGFTFEHPHFWQSSLRNALNYRPGFSYRSVCNNNILRLASQYKKAHSKGLDDTLAAAEKMKQITLGNLSPVECPNEATLLMLHQASLLEFHVGEALQQLCQDRGFKNVAHSERLKFTKKFMKDSNTVIGKTLDV